MHDQVQAGAESARASPAPGCLRAGKHDIYAGQPAGVFFPAVNIRKFVLRAARLSDLVELGSLTPRAATFLEASVRAGLNIMVAGGTQAGVIRDIVGKSPLVRRVVPDSRAASKRPRSMAVLACLRDRTSLRSEARARPAQFDRAVNVMGLGSETLYAD